MSSQLCCDQDKWCVTVGDSQWQVKWLLQVAPVTYILLMIREVEAPLYSKLPPNPLRVEAITRSRKRSKNIETYLS